MLRFSLYPLPFIFFFFFNDTATTEIYTLSLHDALPIFAGTPHLAIVDCHPRCDRVRSEEHTSELQSRRDLVCRLLLEKKKKKNNNYINKQIQNKKKAKSERKRRE